MTRTLQVGDKVRVAKGYYWPNKSRSGVVTEVAQWTVTVDMGASQGIKLFCHKELEIAEESESK